MEKFTLGIKLKSYSALAGSIFSAAVAQGQVIYTDVDPGITVDLSDSSYDLDLNNDGIFEYKIIEQHVTLGSSLWKFEIYAEPVSGNCIAGLAAPGLYQAGDTINSFLPWDNASVQPLAYLVGSWSTAGLPGGNWVDEVDKFMALRFMIGGGQHYGWVRLSIDEGYSATIHDYAYQELPGVSLIAGQVISTNIPMLSFRPEFDISAAGKVISVMASPQTNGEMTINIINMLGQVIKTVDTWNNTYNISLPEAPAGLYLIAIEKDGWSHIQKIALR